MLSLDDRRKLIKYLNENKDKLKDVFNDFKLALVELETENVQTVLTKRRLGEIFHCSKLFLRFIKSISESFEEGEEEE